MKINLHDFAESKQKYDKKKKSLGRDLRDSELAALFETLRTSGKHGLLYYTQGYTGADLMRAMRVALFKALQKSMLLYKDYLRALTLVGGTKSHVIQSQYLSNAPEKKTLRHLIT